MPEFIMGETETPIAGSAYLDGGDMEIALNGIPVAYISHRDGKIHRLSLDAVDVKNLRTSGIEIIGNRIAVAK